MSDKDIVELYWQRKEEAISRTSLAYEAYLMKTADNILNNREDSHETVNDTYLAAWNSMPDNRPERLSTYLGKITRRLAIDRLRRRSSAGRGGGEYALSLEELSDCLAGGSSPEQVCDEAALTEAINRFLQGLNTRDRALFLCRYFHFDPLKEAAAACGITEAAAKTKLFRIRGHLKDYLRKEGFSL